MTTIEITPERITVVKHLASGKSVDIVAAITRLPKHRVIDIGSHHGYPDTAKLAKAAEMMQANLDRQAAELPERRPAVAPPVDRPAHVITSPKPPPIDPSLTKPDEIRVLLNTAKGHPAKRIQAAADRVFDRLDKLRALISEDEEKHAEKRRLEAAREAQRAEVKRLEDQLAAAKAKLRGKPVPAASTDPSTDKTEPSTASVACDHDDCERTFGSPQAMRLHQRRAHEGFDPNAVHADREAS